MSQNLKDVNELNLHNVHYVLEPTVSQISKVFCNTRWLRVSASHNIKPISKPAELSACSASLAAVGIWWYECAYVPVRLAPLRGAFFAAVSACRN